MNPKNLPLKFALLAVLIGLCVLALMTKGLKAGPDIAGGHSLVFQLEAGDQADTDLNVRAIQVLKQRIDPNGLLNITFIPIGSNQIEIRMPAGDAGTAEAKRAYTQALNALARRNISPTEIQSVGEVSGQQRQQRIAGLAGTNEQLARRLGQVGEAMDILAAAEAGVDAAQNDYNQASVKLSQDPDNQQLRQARDQAREQLDAALDRLNEARTTLYKAQRSVRELNLQQETLQRVLEFYVPPREARSLREQPQGEQVIEQRRQQFEQGLAKLKQQHPSRAEQIDEIADLYKTWAQTRTALSDPADLIRLVASAGVLEFRIAPKEPEIGLAQGMSRLITAAQRGYYRDILAEQGPGGVKKDSPFRWYPVQGDLSEYSGQNLITATDVAGRGYILLANQAGLSMTREPSGDKDWELTEARVTTDRQGWPAVGFQFDERGAQLFNNLTSNNINRHMAVLLDDVVYSAPNIRSAISDRGEITGRFSAQEVNDLVRILDAGTLPAKLNPNPISQTSFESTLGEANKNRGIIAAIAGLAAVGLFMLGYYLYAGAIADVALILNIVLVLGAMSLMGAVFTLPGIAGIILTIGIAVDANVLIFERLREEQEKGQTVRTALKNAYERAFSAILDANLTTLLTCVILGWVGTEEVRGFAITLGLGVLFSLFTAMIVTRWIFQILLQVGIVKGSVPMLRFMKPPNVNWMGKRKAFWAVSAVVVILGLAALVGQGSRVLGIEFAGGTRTVFRFQDDALIDGQLPSSTPVQEAFVAAASEKGYDLLAATAQIEQQEEPGQVDRLLGAYDTDGDGTITREEWTAQDGSIEYWRKLMARSGLDADGNGSLSESELAEKPSRMFQLSTTESDMSRIKDIFNEVFGSGLEEQTALEYRIVKGETFEPLNLEIAPDGMTRITETQISSVMPTYRDTFRDYDGGVLLVVNLVDRPISVAELSDRLLTVREGHQPTRILPMETERSSHQFALLVAPGEDLDLGGFAAFAERQMETLAAALERSESTDTLNVGPTVAQERAGLAIVAIILSWLVIIIYLWKRFGSVQWGLAAVICLIHDVVIVVGLVAVSGWIHDTFLGAALMIDSFKIDLPMIAAMLTVIGYSVNDTIVVFDRIRENRGKLSAVSFQTINNSINQTLPRTLLTSFTTFLVVLIMYVWGGPAIHSYNFALLAGILFGTYSSIAIASPLIVGFKQALVAKVAPTA